MRYLKIYENYQTEEEVSKICEKYSIYNWSINQDGLVDVTGNVNLNYKELKKLPLKFGMVSGYFHCDSNYLTTLKGAPQSVGGDFHCSFNNLTTLKGSPESVSGYFWCNWNNLTTLEGAPRSIGGSFCCYNNKLTTLKGAPESVGGNFNCQNNNLTTLEGAPYSVRNHFWCDSMPDLIEKNIKHIKHIIANQEVYHIYNKDGSLNEYRFKLMMDSMD